MTSNRREGQTVTKTGKPYDPHRQGTSDARPHLKRRRRPPTNDRTVSKTLTLPDSTLQKLQRFVNSPQAGGRSESWVAGDAIEEYIANHSRAAV